MSAQVAHHLKSRLLVVLPVIAVATALIALLISKFDRGGMYRWLSFWLYCFSLYTISLRFFFEYSNVLKTLVKAVSSPQLRWWLLTVFLITVISRLWQLDIYPFVSVGDELREVGLYAMQVAQGERKDIFGYGAYQAYGMIIPTISSFFYSVFGSSILTYRLQAAMLGVLDVVLVYVITLLATKNYKTSLFASIILASLPLHLYYSRTEVVVMYASTFTLVLLILWYLVKKQATTANILMLAVTLGFAFGLYAAVRTVALFILMLLIAQLVRPLFNFKQLNGALIKKCFMQLMVVAIFLVVGFGPRLWFTTTRNFFHTSRLPFFEQHQEVKVAWELPKKYLQSVMVWYNEPTSSWYADHKPIVLPLFTLLLALGAFFALATKNRFLIDVVALLLVLHFTNSAMTDIVNADHRLAPLYGIGAVLMAVGLATILQQTKNEMVRRGLVLLVVAICAVQLIGFFTNQPANKNKHVVDYLSMQIVKHLQASQTPYAQMIITVSPSNYDTLRTPHYKEQYQYFFPGSVVVFTQQRTLIDQEAIITTIPAPLGVDTTTIVPCRPLTCPKGQNNFVLLHRVR